MENQMSNVHLWIGRGLSGVAVLFLLMDCIMKLMKAKPALEATLQLGFPEHSLIPIGMILFACLLIYVLPWTAPLGAILLTGYLGGAVAAHIRVDNPLLSHVLFPVYVGVFIWGGLLLRFPHLLRLFRLTGAE